MKEMPKYGKLDERDLADKLLKVSEEEMMKFHKQRMKNYRIYYIIPLILGIICTLIYILVYQIIWIAIILSVTGIVILSIGSFKRLKWKRLFENMLYLKRKREKTIEKMKSQRNPYPNKYDSKK